jgi:hypothetical protein
MIVLGPFIDTVDTVTKPHMFLFLCDGISFDNSKVVGAENLRGLHLGTGTVTQLNQVICTGSNTGKFTWYCATNMSKFVVAVAPPILLSLWQQMVLPVLFYW